MGIITISWEVILLSNIIIILIILAVAFWRQYITSSQLRKDVDFLNKSLKDHFLTPDEFVIEVIKDGDDLRILLKKPNGNSRLESYKFLVEFFKSAEKNKI